MFTRKLELQLPCRVVTQDQTGTVCSVSHLADLLRLLLPPRPLPVSRFDHPSRQQPGLLSLGETRALDSSSQPSALIHSIPYFLHPGPVAAGRCFLSKSSIERSLSAYRLPRCPSSLQPSRDHTAVSPQTKPGARSVRHCVARGESKSDSIETGTDQRRLTQDKSIIATGNSSQGQSRRQ